MNSLRIADGAKGFSPFVAFQPVDAVSRYGQRFVNVDPKDRTNRGPDAVTSRELTVWKGASCASQGTAPVRADRRNEVTAAQTVPEAERLRARSAAYGNARRIPAGLFVDIMA
jgi:hypothetical protein